MKSIFMVGALVALIATPYYNKHLFYAFNTLWGRFAVVLFLFILIACLWSPAAHSIQLTAASKYMKLLYLPILAVGFIDPKTRNLAVISFLAVMVLTCIVSILKDAGLILSGEAGQVVYNHIVTGFMMAFACYLAGLRAIQSKGWSRLVYGAIVLLTSYQVFFINTGRVAYLLCFILTCMLLLQHLPVKKAMLGILCFCGLIFGIYTQSTVLQLRVHDLLNDIRDYRSNNINTSLGYRIQFHHYAKGLFKQHPVRGVGTGGYKYHFAKENPVPSWGIATSDPHSQYWLILSEFGIVGFVLFFAFLGSLLVTSMKLEENKPILWGILISFCIGSLTDTFFCYSTVGYLLVVFSALCFGELIQKERGTHTL